MVHCSLTIRLALACLTTGISGQLILQTVFNASWLNEVRAEATTQPAMPELASASFVYGDAAGLGYDKDMTRRDPSDVIRVGSE